MKRHLNKVIQNKKSKILVSIIMGSQSDWKTMQHAAKLLRELKVPFEKKKYQLIGHQKDSMNMPPKQKQEELK